MTGAHKMWSGPDGEAAERWAWLRPKILEAADKLTARELPYDELVLPDPWFSAVEKAVGMRVFGMDLVKSDDATACVRTEEAFGRQSEPIPLDYPR